MVELVVRLVFSLAVIIGMLMLLTRFSAKRFRGGSDALVRVVHRQPLSRSSAVAVVTVGSRVLLVGTTEQQVQLLTELDPEEIELPELVVGESVAAPYQPRHAAPSVPVPAGAVLAGAVPAGAASDGAGSDGAASAAPAAAASSVVALRVAGRARVADGALAGSLLSAQTWKQAFAAATTRTQDAS